LSSFRGRFFVHFRGFWWQLIWIKQLILRQNAKLLASSDNGSKSVFTEKVNAILHGDGGCPTRLFDPLGIDRFASLHIKT
jgi:hypothetical protein